MIRGTICCGVRGDGDRTLWPLNTLRTDQPESNVVTQRKSNKAMRLELDATLAALLWLWNVWSRYMTTDDPELTLT